MDHSPNNYAIIDYETSELTITYLRKTFSTVRVPIPENELLDIPDTIRKRLNNKEGLRIFRLVGLPNKKESISQAKLINGKLVWKIDEHQVEGPLQLVRAQGAFCMIPRSLKDSKYESLAENLITAKNKIYDTGLNINKDIKEDLLNKGVLKTHIKDYLGI
jgi:hypothetical protein